MFCRKCGAQLEEDAKFCEKCGTPTGAEPMPEEDKQSSATETVETSETPPKKPKKTMGKIIKTIIGRTLLIIILLIAILLLLDYLGVIDTATIDAFMERTGMTKETGEETALWRCRNRRVRKGNALMQMNIMLHMQRLFRRLR